MAVRAIGVRRKVEDQEEIRSHLRLQWEALNLGWEFWDPSEYFSP